MNNEFKKISGKNQTRYVLEDSTAGTTPAGSIASISGQLGGIQQRVAKENTDTHPDHEIKMASGELKNIVKNAGQLLQLVKAYNEMDGLPAWQQSKITKAADYLNSVLQSVENDVDSDDDEWIGFDKKDTLAETRRLTPADKLAKGLKKGGFDIKDSERRLKAIQDRYKKPAPTDNKGVAEGSEEKDPVWNKGTPMPKDYTCHCGLYVHPSRRNPKAIHTSDCPYAKKQDKEQGVAEGLEENLSVEQLATISDEALDKAYGYGRSSPGNSFGWQANLKSAAYAKQMIDRGVTDIEAISDAIHKGWNVTARAFVQNPDQFGDTEKLRAAGKLDAKLEQRAKLMKIEYGQLPNDEQEKDRVVARALLQAIKGSQQGVAEADKDRFRNPTTGSYTGKGSSAYQDRHAGVEPEEPARPRSQSYRAAKPKHFVIIDANNPAEIQDAQFFGLTSTKNPKVWIWDGSYTAHRSYERSVDPEQKFKSGAWKRWVPKNEDAGKGISQDQETQFRAQLDKLVHNTFGKRKDELEELDTSTLVNYVPAAGRSLKNLSPDQQERRQQMMTRAFKKVMSKPNGRSEIDRYRKADESDSYTNRLAEKLDSALDEKSKSQKQARTMAAAAHDPAFAKRVGIKQNVAREFNRADTGQNIKKLPVQVPKKKKK